MAAAVRAHDPSVVALGVYGRDGRMPDEPDLTSALAAARAAGGFVWLGLLAPTHASISETAEQLGLPPLAVEDALNPHERPKLEVYEDLTFTVLRPVRYVDHEEVVDVAEVAVFLGPDVVVTVRHGESDVVARTRAEVDADGADLLSFGPVGVLYRLADLTVDDYERVIADLDVDVDEIEDEVFGPDEQDHSRRIYLLKQEVAVFRRALGPLAKPLERLAACEAPHATPEVAPYFRDVHDHVLRAWESLELVDRQLSDALEANTARVTMVQNRIALRQNEDMRKISAWAAMGLVPTAIAGVYGMNFRAMPFLDSAWGFPGTMAAMVAVCVGLYRAFRRNGWL